MPRKIGGQRRPPLQGQGFNEAGAVMPRKPLGEAADIPS